MPLVAELVKNTPIGQENGIGSAGTSPKDFEAFKTVIAEARTLRAAGEIEIIVEQVDRVRFKRLR
jgi:hypothetical protein